MMTSKCVTRRVVVELERGTKQDEEASEDEDNEEREKPAPATILSVMLSPH